MSLLREAIKNRRRKRKKFWDEPEGKENDGLSPGKITDVNADHDADETGQMAEAAKMKESPGKAAQLDDEMNIEETAEKVLGRKPMSTVRNSKPGLEVDIEEEGPENYDEEIAGQIVDKYQQEQLKKGKRKPRTIHDRMMLSLANLKK